MNIEPANVVWPVRGTFDAASHGKGSATDAESARALAKRGDDVPASTPAAKKELDAGTMLQLLQEGRVGSARDVRLRAGGHEAERTTVGAQARASARNAGEEIHDPLRALLATGLFDEETRALLEAAFTRLDPDAEASGDEQNVDAEQLYREFREAFEEFHDSLKRIFRLVEESESEEPWLLAQAAGEDETPAASAAPEASQEGATAAEKASAAQEELIRRIVEAYRTAIEHAPASGDAEHAEDPAHEDATYARFAAAYAELYGALSDDESPSFSTEG